MRIESNYNYINPIRTLNTQQRFTFTSQPDKFVQATKAPAKKTVGKVRHFINNFLIKTFIKQDEPNNFLKLAKFMKEDSEALFNLYTKDTGNGFWNPAITSLLNLRDRHQAYQLLADKPEVLSKILLHKNKDEGFSIGSCLHESDVRVIYKILKDHPEEYKKIFIDDASHKACLLADDIIGIINGEPNAKELLNESYIKHMISGDIHPLWAVKILLDIEKYFRSCEPSYAWDKLAEAPSLNEDLLTRLNSTQLNRMKNSLTKLKNKEADIKKIEDIFIADLKSNGNANIFMILKSTSCLKDIKPLIGDRLEDLKDIFLLKDSLGRTPIQMLMAKFTNNNKESIKIIHNLFEKEPEFLVEQYLLDGNTFNFKTLPLLQVCSNQHNGLELFKNIFDDIKDAKNIDKLIEKLFSLEKLYSTYYTDLSQDEKKIYTTLKEITSFLDNNRIRQVGEDKTFLTDEEVFKTIDSITTSNPETFQTVIDKNGNSLLSRFADIVPKKENEESYKKALAKIMSVKDIDFQRKDELGLSVLEKILNTENEMFLDAVSQEHFVYDPGLDIEYARIVSPNIKQKAKKLIVSFPDLYQAIELESRKAIDTIWVQVKSPFFSKANLQRLESIVNGIKNTDLKLELKYKLEQLEKDLK